VDGLLREGVPSGQWESVGINLKDKRSNWNAKFPQLNWLLRLDAIAEAPYIWMEDAMVVDSIGADSSRGRVGYEAFGSAGAHGTAFSFVRCSQSLRAPGVLHAACLGVEGESQRHVRELEPQRFVRDIRGQNP